MKIPQVRIKFSELLYDNVSVHLNELWAKGRDSIASKEQCEEWAENYRQEWAKYESKILPAICQELSLEFHKPVIDVSLAPWIRAMSDPLIMSFNKYPNQFVDALTHELVHVLLTDNNKFTFFDDGAEPLDERWKKLFGEEHSFTTLVHIPVHAVLKYVYLDVLDEPNRLERDIDDNKKTPGYKEAWQYVEDNDYKQIINKLKNSY